MSIRSLILKTLLNRSASIADLQEISPVSLPTLRKAIQELSDERWIRVIGQAEKSGGRPAMLFGLDDAHHLMIGVHLQLPGVRLIATDLAGNVLHVFEAFSQEVPQPDDVVSQVVTYVNEIQSFFPDRAVVGVGIASPGFTHPATGDIISIGRVSGWQNFPICQRLGTVLNLPVQIANDVDCMAFAEFQHTQTNLENNLLYIGFDEGVKVSMFLNGLLYKGSFGNAGLIVPDLLHLNHGLPREAYRKILTIDGLNQRFDERLASRPEAEKSQYNHILEETRARRRFQAILAGAADGLSVCVEITDTLNTVLATTTANLIYTIQPDKVVVGGMLSELPPPVYARLEAAIRSHLSSLFTNYLVIQQASLSSPDLAARGAIYHFLQVHFEA
jgi:predicted NBD/HSP70 family sugar kinase